jgi:predicted type IV restriction endonuclease
MREEIKKGIKEEIAKLTERYNSLKKSKSHKEMGAISEANVRADFIDDLFCILGWKIKNPDEYDRENYVRKVGHADVALKLNKEPVVFIEAKKFGAIPFVDRDTMDWIEEERQVMNYAASPERKIKWAVLTNFEKLRVFNALNGTLIISFEAPWDYIEKIEWLLYLTKDSIESGRINSLETRREKPDIDLRFLQSLNNWRLKLANDIYEKNKDNNVLKDEKDKICLEKLKSAVQRILAQVSGKPHTHLWVG